MLDGTQAPGTSGQPAGAGLGAADALDAKLAGRGRSAGILRLRLAEGLERLAAANGQHELGFATIEAYALERCERSARWVQESRALARRLQQLPAVRAEVLSGRMTFSMAQVVAAATREDDEMEWLALSRGQTVRALRELSKGWIADGGGDKPRGRPKSFHAPRKISYAPKRDELSAWARYHERRRIKPTPSEHVAVWHVLPVQRDPSATAG